jgi:lipopolysaccharide/colanic/teichoic acid biosynthesis glycosyltransferase
LTLINDIPVLELKNTSLSGWNVIFKRVFDLFSSVTLIFIFSPVLFIVSILIKLEDPSAPTIFKNKRV